MTSAVAAAERGALYYQQPSEETLSEKVHYIAKSVFENNRWRFVTAAIISLYAFKLIPFSYTLLQLFFQTFLVAFECYLHELSPQEVERLQEETGLTTRQIVEIQRRKDNCDGKNLDLSNLGLTSLPCWILKGISNECHINLSQNQIRDIEPLVLHYNYKSLDLSQNPLGPFFAVFKYGFRDSASVILRGCGLTRVNLDCFKGCSEVVLDDNENLTDLSGKFEMQKLQVNNCNLHFIPEGVTQPSNLIIFSAQNNPVLEDRRSKLQNPDRANLSNLDGICNFIADERAENPLPKWVVAKAAQFYASSNLLGRLLSSEADTLDLTNLGLRTFPKEIADGNYKNAIIDLSNNPLGFVPEILKNIEFKGLRMTNCQLHSLPTWLLEKEGLEVLELSANDLGEFFASLPEDASLTTQKINLSGCQLKGFDLDRLQVQQLNLAQNPQIQLSGAISQGMTKLDLYHCGLEQLPGGVLDSFLEEVDAMGNPALDEKKPANCALNTIEGWKQYIAHTKGA